MPPTSGPSAASRSAASIRSPYRDGADANAWERGHEGTATADKPAPKSVSKNGVNPNFGMNMPLMSSAFDTAMWMNAA